MLEHLGEENHLSQALMLSELMEDLDCWDPWPSCSGSGVGLNDLWVPSSSGNSTILKSISIELSKPF